MPADTTSSAKEQLPADRGDRHGWGVGISLGVVGFAMIVLLVLPGFLAAGFSRIWVVPITIYSVNNDVNWDADYSKLVEPTHVRVELFILAPSGWLMKHSPLIHRFYNWQYRTAGGVDIDITG